MILVGCDLHTRKQQVALLNTDTGELLLPHTRRRRDDSLELLHWLNGHIDALDLHVATAAAADPDARRLKTHPGVGPLTALATVLVLGPVGRFPGSKHVVSYIGLPPAVNASADKYRLGHIRKQGSTLLRWVLGQAAPLATRGDAGLKRIYFAVLRRRGRPKAKVALARRLLIRLYVMLRDHIDYGQAVGAGSARLIAPFVLAWEEDMAAQRGVATARRSLLGRLIMAVGRPVCARLGQSASMRLAEAA
jgi:Transposase IS116/IS110/IS902 family